MGAARRPVDRAGRRVVGDAPGAVPWRASTTWARAGGRLVTCVTSLGTGRRRSPGGRPRPTGPDHVREAGRNHPHDGPARTPVRGPAPSRVTSRRSRARHRPGAGWSTHARGRLRGHLPRRGDRPGPPAAEQRPSPLPPAGTWVGGGNQTLAGPDGVGHVHGPVLAGEEPGAQEHQGDPARARTLPHGTGSGQRSTPLGHPGGKYASGVDASSVSRCETGEPDWGDLATPSRLAVHVPIVCHTICRDVTQICHMGNPRFGRDERGTPS